MIQIQKKVDYWENVRTLARVYRKIGSDVLRHWGVNIPRRPQAGGGYWPPNVEARGPYFPIYPSQSPYILIVL